MKWNRSLKMIQLKHLVMMIIFLGGLWTKLSAQFDGATIDARQRAFIEDDGRYWLQKYGSEKGCYRQCIFAWLENNNHQNDDKIVEEIDLLMSTGDPNDRWENSWTCQSHPARMTLLRVILGYTDVLNGIQPGLANTIRALYSERIKKGDMFHANPNGQLRGNVVMYLFAERYEPDLEVTYPTNWDANNIWPVFTYEGRRYENGQNYRALDLCGDWLQWKFDDWTDEYCKNQEFASVNYTRMFIDGLVLLYDFALDQEMKRKAKMILDFLLLDAVLNYSGNHWGGPHKRMYLQSYWKGYDSFYWQFFWGLRRPAGDNRTIADVYVTGYRPSLVIEDIGVLSDESDDYYHINRFSNLAFNIKEHGSYCYVTKNYNLGTGFNWQLNIYSEDGSGTLQGKPFMLWINNKPYSDPNDPFSSAPGTSEYYDGGDDGYQHRNAMLVVPNGKPYLHISIGSNSFDEKSNEDGWQFYREGKVAIAIQMSSSCAGLEVATVGVDYNSYQEFKSAIKNNARLEGNRFTTSKGKVITSGYVDGAYPFERLEATDNQNNKIVEWNNRVMTIRKHGRTVVYDFNNWRYYEDSTSWDIIPPDPPQGVKASSGK
jgi:hypothetical protein